MPTSPRILFLATNFPVLSETFVWREAASLAALGRVDFMSMAARPADGDAFPPPVRALMDTVAYRRTTPTEIAAALAAAFGRPRAMFAAWRRWRGVYGWRRCLSRLYALARLRSRLRHRPVDVIHAQWRGAGDVAHVYSWLFGTPYTLFLHAHDIYDEGLAEPNYRPLFTAKVEAAAAVFTCTERNRQALAGLFPAARIALCYHGIPAEILATARGRPRTAASLHLLSTGRLIAYKGFDDLVSVATRLRALDVPFVWDVIGAGPLAKPLARQIAEQRLEGCVVLRGALPNAEVLAAMRDADVFVFLGKQSSGQYGLPNVLLEAAACGLCIVSRPLDTLPELIEPGISGLVADAADDVAATIAALAKSPERAATLGRAAQARARHGHKHEAHVGRLHAELISIAEGREPAQAAA